MTVFDFEVIKSINDRKKKRRVEDGRTQESTSLPEHYIISYVDDNRAHFYITGSSIEHYYNTEQYDAVRYIVQHRVIE